MSAPSSRRPAFHSGLTKRRATAYHEAGPAVADYLFGFTPMKATIHRHGNRLGAVSALDHWVSPEKTGRENRRDVRRGIVSLLAGHAAEVEFCGKDGRKLDGACSDFERAAEELHTWLGATSRLGTFRARARNLVRRHRAKITRVAEELLRHDSLNPDELKILIAERGKGLAEYRAAARMDGGGAWRR